MMNFLASYAPLVDAFLLNSGVAFSQYVALRGGVLSLATAGLAAIGAYTAAALTLKAGLSFPIGLAAATAMGTAVAIVLSLPLARLRGVFQAIATLAFVEIVISLIIYAEDITGGALGLNGIPKAISTWHLLVFILVVTYFVRAIDRSGIGRAFDVIREDETVAATMGISIVRYQTLAFAISGAIAGLSGGLMAYNTYSLSPDQFGFGLLVMSLISVVLGGRKSIGGPIVGALILTFLPEIVRPVTEYRFIVFGVLLVLVTIFLPEGVVDTFRSRRRLARAALRFSALRKEGDRGAA